MNVLTPVPPWTASVIPVLFIQGFILLIAGLYNAPITHLIQTWRMRQVRRANGRLSLIEGLVVPLPILSIQHIVVGTIGSGIVATLLISRVAGSIWSVLLAIPVTAALGIVVLLWLDSRQNRRLGEQVIDAAIQVGSIMNGGATLTQAIKQVGEGLNAPLTIPWTWMMEMVGAAIFNEAGERRFATLPVIARAVAGQTTSRDFIRLLEHIEAAADLPHAAARDRLQAASAALQASRLREKSILAKLSHSRGSAFVVCFVGIGIAFFLRLALPERWDAAFSSAFGPIAMVFFGMVFGLPLVSTYLLSRAPDIDF